MYRTQDTWVAGKLIQSMYQKNQTKKTINKIKHLPVSKFVHTFVANL